MFATVRARINQSNWRVARVTILISLLHDQFNTTRLEASECRQTWRSFKEGRKEGDESWYHRCFNSMNIYLLKLHLRTTKFKGDYSLISIHLTNMFGVRWYGLDWVMLSFRMRRELWERDATMTQREQG